MISNHKNLRNRLKETHSSGCAMGRTLRCRERNHTHPSSTTSLKTAVHTRMYECACTHMHVYTICLYTGRSLGQLCGGQASPHLAVWEGQAPPDGLHLRLITTHQAGWTQPLNSET